MAGRACFAGLSSAGLRVGTSESAGAASTHGRSGYCGASAAPLAACKQQMLYRQLRMWRCAAAIGEPRYVLGAQPTDLLQAV